LHFRNAPKEEHEKKRNEKRKAKKKKHLTVWLFGIHCEFKGRLSDRNNKEARDGSVDDNVRPRRVGGGWEKETEQLRPK